MQEILFIDIIKIVGDNMKEKIYTYNEINYKLVINYKDAFDNAIVLEKVTDYFNEYDYIVGDWSYGSLRLKGFCKKENKLFNKINNYDKLDEYLKNNCAYGCKYFVLEKVVA